MAKRNKLTRTQVEELTFFITRARKLPERDCFRFLVSYKSSINIEWRHGEEIKLSNLAKPEIETFRSYLIDFRPFVSKREPVFVERILQTCINKARHIAFRERLIRLRDEWLSAKSIIPEVERGSSAGRVALSSDEHFQMWLNGNIFHLDLEAERFFEGQPPALVALFEVKAAKYIGWCSNFILRLATTIETGLNNNEFDYINEHTPHNKPNVAGIVSEDSKTDIIRFWNGTRRIPQSFATCGEHDQDPIIVVEGYTEGMTDFKNVKVEIRACCPGSIDKALKTISVHQAWMELFKNNPNYNAGFVSINEFEITQQDDIENIKGALKNYKLKWRRSVGDMRCGIHKMPPGVRAFGEDMYHQGSERIYSGAAVYFQGCCELFMQEVLDRLRTRMVDA